MDSNVLLKNGTPAIKCALPQALMSGGGSLEFWTYAFTVTAYAMTATCLYRGFRNGYEDARICGVIRELLVFSGMVGLLFFVESWAHFRGPYYAYAPTFPDLIPRIPLEWTGIKGGEMNDCCTQLVTKRAVRFIPLSVVLFEASLVYAAMWTARRITHSLALQPLFAGLALLLIDLLLDPVLATAHSCKDALKPAGVGVGLWRWYLPAESDLCGGSPGTCPERIVAHFFDVPVFNYAAWLGAPIAVIALVNVIPFFREGLRPLAKGGLGGHIERVPVLGSCLRALARELPEGRETPKGVWLLGLGIAMVPIAFIVYAAPTFSSNNPGRQYGAFFVGLGLVLFFLVNAFGSYKKDRTELDGVLIVPVVFALATGILAGLFEDRFIVRPWLMPVAIVALLVGLWLHFFPYCNWLLSFARRLGRLDRFLRLHYFGFTALLILLGAALCCSAPHTYQVAGLLVIALAFHVYSYVLNDCVDLELDRKQPQRQRDPLVDGTIKKHQAIALALACVPVAFFGVLLLLRFDPARAPLAPIALAGAVVLMTVYNVWGKRVRWPLLTDWAQGLAWGGLAVVGTAVAAASPTDPRVSAQTAYDPWLGSALLGAWGMLYIVLISGIHGGLRDLVGDARGGARTTAMALGAVPASGDVISSGLVAAYAHVVHTLLFATLAAFVAQYHDKPVAGGQMFPGIRLPFVVALLVILFVVATYMLQRVVQRSDPRPSRRDWIGWHALFLLAPPMIVFALANGPELAFKITVFCATFVPLLLAEWLLVPLLEWLYSRVSANASL